MIGDGTQVIDEAGRRHGWRRPVALPDDIETSPKATGVVALPVRVYWSDRARTWDLSDPRQRARVYEIVMTEGTDDDVRRFIDVDEVTRLWSELYVPQHVRDVWRAFLERTRNIDVGC
jgi:hypothetical protein